MRFYRNNHVTVLKHGESENQKKKQNSVKSLNIFSEYTLNKATYILILSSDRNALYQI